MPIDISSYSIFPRRSETRLVNDTASQLASETALWPATALATLPFPVRIACTDAYKYRWRRGAHRSLQQPRNYLVLRCKTGFSNSRRTVREFLAREYSLNRNFILLFHFFFLFRTMERKFSSLTTIKLKVKMSRISFLLNI